MTYISNENNIENITPNHVWTIIADQGDTFSITVTPLTNNSQGESSTITAGIDCELHFMYILSAYVLNKGHE